MANTHNLTTRVVVLVLGTCMAFASAFAWLVVGFRTELYDEHETAPRVAVEAAMSEISSFVALEQKGALTREQAQAAALEAVGRIRFDGDNYVWVNDLHPTMVMHPLKPELNGKDLTSYADPKGKRLFVEMVAVVKRAGSGRVEYQWPKPGQKAPVGKISWVVLQQDWGWVVGAGVYTDDVAAQVGRVIWRAALVGFLLTLAAGVVGWLMARKLAAPLHVAIGALRTSAEEVRRASASVAGIAQHLASGASASASAVQQSTTAMGDVSTRTDSNASGAANAEGIATRAIADMSGANGAMSATVTQMSALAAKGQEVGKIVKTINEIAFQTNLLALNAAVEASRAGDAGKGFAVVAEEVRALALRSAEAAQNTGELIEATVKGINASSESVGRVHREFQRVGEGVAQVAKLVTSIATASKEQAVQLREVGTGLTEIDQATQRNAASAEEIASAAEELSGQADSLTAVVGQMDTLVDGEKRAA